MVTAAEIHDIVDARKDEYIAASRYIWEQAELFFREDKSAAYLIDALKKDGFTVREQVGGINTAFVGEFGGGKPVIGILGEYDALPSLSQKAAKPSHDPLVEGAPGHGCGHNALGAGSLAAAFAVKAYMQKHSLPGTVRFYGCPAEEAGWAKMFMARDGLFDDLDAAVTWHPQHFNTMQGLSSLANICAYFRFTGKTAHAAVSPHLGRSALDACELMNVGVNYLREHVVPGTRMHYAYQDVGGDAPNVVQDHACVKYFLRAPKIVEVLDITERVKDVARGAALMTGTSVEISVTAGMCDFVPNDVMGRLFTDAMNEVGPPRFDDADRELARQFRAAAKPEDLVMGLRMITEIYPDSARFADAPLIEEILPYRRISSEAMGSTDVGDVSYAAPTVQMNVACFANGSPIHSWLVTGQSGSSIADKGLLCAAEAMALGTIRLMEDPGLLAEARAEYVKATGGKYICPVGPDAKPVY